MRMHVLRHVPFEDEANIGVWARDKGFRVSHTDFHAGRTPPEPADLDWLVVMGGPMNIYEEDRHPWLAGEKRSIEAAVAAGKVVLGVCLGAQLIADVLGGSVTRGEHKEIGWHPVTLADPASGLFARLPREVMAFHWHGDTFAIPPGATRVAHSPGCANQGFVYQGRVLGLQFHLETSLATMEALMTHCAEDITPGPWVQDAATMRAGAGNLPRILSNMTVLLDDLLAQTGGI